MTPWLAGAVGRWLRVWAGAVLLAAALLATVPAEAAPKDVVEQHFRARGATVRLLARAFVFERQALVRPIETERAGCWAVFAWGSSGLRDIDISLYTRAGQLASEDRAALSYGYARLCTGAGVALYASALAYAGQGEISLFFVQDAPRELGRFPPSISTVVSQGGRASPERTFGGNQEIQAASEAAFVAEVGALFEQGYMALGPASALELRAGLAQGSLFLRGGSCFRVLAFVPGARGMMVDLAGAEATREARAADAEVTRVVLCTQEDGVHALRVRARSVHPAAYVRVFVQPLVGPDDADTYGEERALALGEARVIAHEHGMTLHHLGEVWLDGGAPLRWPVAVHASQCHMFMALPERNLQTELRLLDDQGVVLASHDGRRGLPVVWACPRTASEFRLMVQGRGASGPVSLWWGRGAVQ